MSHIVRHDIVHCNKSDCPLWGECCASSGVKFEKDYRPDIWPRMDYSDPPFVKVQLECKDFVGIVTEKQ